MFSSRDVSPPHSPKSTTSATNSSAARILRTGFVLLGATISWVGLGLVYSSVRVGSWPSSSSSSSLGSSSLLYSNSSDDDDGIDDNGDNDFDDDFDNDFDDDMDMIAKVESSSSSKSLSSPLSASHPAPHSTAPLPPMGKAAVCLVGGPRTLRLPQVHSSIVRRLVAPLNADVFAVLALDEISGDDDDGNDALDAAVNEAATLLDKKLGAVDYVIHKRRWERKGDEVRKVRYAGKQTTETAAEVRKSKRDMMTATNGGDSGAHAASGGAGRPRRMVATNVTAAIVGKRRRRQEQLWRQLTASSSVIMLTAADDGCVHDDGTPADFMSSPFDTIMWMHRMMSECMELVRGRERMEAEKVENAESKTRSERGRNRYDWVIKARPDMVWVRPIPYDLDAITIEAAAAAAGKNTGVGAGASVVATIGAGNAFSQSAKAGGARVGDVVAFWSAIWTDQLFAVRRKYADAAFGVYDSYCGGGVGGGANGGGDDDDDDDDDNNNNDNDDIDILPIPNHTGPIQTAVKSKESNKVIPLDAEGFFRHYLDNIAGVAMRAEYPFPSIIRRDHYYDKRASYYCDNYQGGRAFGPTSADCMRWLYGRGDSAAAAISSFASKSSSGRNINGMSNSTAAATTVTTTHRGGVVNGRNDEGDCFWVEESVLYYLSPSETNRLRRYLMKERPACYNRHKSLFIDAFVKRIGMKHLNLHIPKTGGTSLCNMIKQNNITTGKLNCWIDKTCPYWCCCPEPSRLSCSDLKSVSHDFVGNERFLDHPLCDTMRVYSVTVREAVSRAISHVQHKIHFVLEAGAKTYERKGVVGVDGSTWDYTAESLNIVQSNYMTWSLLSGTRPDPLKYVPRWDDLPVAKSVLAGFDYIIDISSDGGGGGDPAAAPTVEACNDVILRAMGMRVGKGGGGEGGKKTGVGGKKGTDVLLSLGRDTQGSKPGYQALYRPENYESMNKIDSELYRYATELINLDCQFILSAPLIATRAGGKRNSN